MKPIQPDKVVGNAVREPINRQAALIMRKCPEQFRPQPGADLEELQRLRAENNTMKQKIISQAQECKLLNIRLQQLREKLDESKQHLKEVIAKAEAKCVNLRGKELEEKQKMLKKYKIYEELTGLDEPTQIVLVKTHLKEFPSIKD